MPDTDLSPYDPTTTFLPSLSVAGRVWNLAQQIHRTEFVPGQLRGKPEAIMAAMLTGREIGIGAMHSLRAIDVIDGRPSLSPELLHALALRAGHDLDVVESTRSGCTVVVRRHDWPTDRERTVTFDEVDARLAGLVGKDCKPADGVHPNTTTTSKGNPTCGCKQGYRTYPRAMYRARAIAEACRTHLPDVVERIGYTAEEFGGEDPPHATALETVREVLGDEAADRIAEQTSDDEVLEADVVDDDEDDGGVAVEDEPEPDAPAPAPMVECPNGCDNHDCSECYVQDEPSPRCQDGHDGPFDTIDTLGTRRCRACGATVPPEPTPKAPADVEDPASSYADLTTTDVVGKIRSGDLDPADAWRLEVAVHGKGDPKGARKTVRAMVESKGVDVRVSAPEATAGGKDAPARENGPGEAVHVPEGMPEAELEYRRTVLKRYRSLYRETFEVDEAAAAKMHALRLETVGGSDGAILWVDRADVERFLAGANEIHASVVPF